MIVQSDMHLVETVLQILNFDLFPGLMICSTALFGDAGQQQRATAPSQPCDTRVNNWYSIAYYAASVLSIFFSLVCFLF